MAKLSSKTVGTFTEFDSTVSDANKFINVRDMQVFRQNHNALLANGARRNVGTCMFGYSGATYTQKKVENLDSTSIVDNVPILRARVIVSANCKQLECWVRGSLVSAEYESECSLVLHVFNPRNPRDMDRQNAMTWTSNGVIAEKECTVDLPLFARDKIHRYREFEVGLYMLPELVDTNIIVGSTVSISSSSQTGISVSSSAAIANITTGDIIETTTGDRQIVQSRGGSAISIYGRWQDAPSGSLVYAAHVPQIKLYEMALMELPVSDFSAEVSRI